MKRPRILFVDDDALLLNTLARVLRAEAARWDMTFVVGGEKALAVLKNSEPFDVVVSDFDMPHVNGVDVLDAAHRLVPDSRRILFTGSDVDDNEVPHAHAVLSKHDPIAQLRLAIDRITSMTDADDGGPRRTTTIRIAIRKLLEGRDKP